MSNARTALLSALAALVIAAVIILGSSSQTVTVPIPAPGQNPVSPPAGGSVSPDPSAPNGALGEQIQGVLEQLRSSGPVDLEALRQAVLADPVAAQGAIERFLASGEDAAIRQSFTVGPGGTLTGTPTLRIFLLDLLGQVARLNGSRSGAVLARSILEKKESPDEWALALRNVAWAEPDSRPYLAAKMHELLAYEPWKASPTAGLLEAFDVAVHSGDPTLIPDLANLSRTATAPLQRAATVALDRLAERSSLAVMNYLNTHPGELADRPFVRADYFAKADLSDTAQREAVERYLTRPDATAAEKSKFLHALAAPGSFVSESLLETAAPPSDLAKRDLTIAAVTAQWLKNGRFPELRTEVEWLQKTVTEP